MEGFSFEWKIKREHEGILLRDFLLKEVNVSRRALTDLKFHGGKITVNGKEQTVRYMLKHHDILNIQFPTEERSEKLLIEKMPLDIVYEDEHLLVINKPAGVCTIPSREHPSQSIANGLLNYYEQQGIKSAVHVVTRLDRDTSGLLLVAKHRFCHHLFSLQQRNNLVKRRYKAVVHGQVIDQKGTINKPIGRNEDSIIEREVREDGKAAVTHYEVILTKKDKSLLSIRLETGRTHQIRVHMSHFGHPLLGDDLYGGLKMGIDRQALHCDQLCFLHPFSKEEISLQIELPKDIQKVIISSR
jgi:23S rRNA pseudouridine1911/1915/1917 synthase